MGDDMMRNNSFASKHSGGGNSSSNNNNATNNISSSGMILQKLFSDNDEIHVGDDGFLYLQKQQQEQEHQPLLLHSTKELLQMLYPNQSMESVLNFKINRGHFDPQTEEPKLLTGEATELVAGNKDDNDGEEGEEEEDLNEDDPEDDDVDETVNVNEGADDDDDNGDEKDGGNDDDDNNDKKKKKQNIPSEYLIYQKLVRCPNISSKAQSAIIDIRMFRNRSNKDRKNQKQFHTKLSWEEQKVRALESQQQRILLSQQQQQQQRTESIGTTTTTTTNATTASSENESMDIDDDFDRMDIDDDGDGNGVVEADAVAEQQENDNGDVRYDNESQYVRIARTVNSIRALYPHLLPLLNHPRRSDKKMVIKNVRLKTAKKRAMCWILGTNVYDITTGKFWKTIYEDAKNLLQAFVPVPTAELIIEDNLGGPIEYWTGGQFLADVRQRSQPQIMNPLQILANYGPLSGDEAREVAIRCDKDLCMHVVSTTQNDNKSKIQKQYDRAVERFQKRLSNILGRRFPGSRVSIYGSCLSNLSLGEGADVDISVWTPEADKSKADFHDGKISASKYEKSIKDMAFAVSRKLKNMKHEFADVNPVPRARVPVVKGRFINGDNPYTDDGSIHFDICFLNDIAVANSGLLRQYSLVDPRVRSLMMTVKQWAKEYKLNSAKDNYISSYAWVNLVIFYLQCLGYVPNLQNRQLMADVNVAPNPEGNYWHNINKLDTCTLTWGEVNRAKAWSPPQDFHDLPVSALLYGFYEFYSCRFPSSIFAVSIKEGTLARFKFDQRKVNLFLCIEDPFETFDSHNPHDLGTPAGEKGAREIMKHLHEAERHLRKLLCGETEVSSLWPEAPFVDPHQSAGTHKKGQYARFEAPKVATGTDGENNAVNTAARVPSKGRGGLFASNNTKNNKDNKVPGKDGSPNANKPRGGGGGRRGKPRHPRPPKQGNINDHQYTIKNGESTQPAGENTGQRRHGNKQNSNQDQTRKGGHNHQNNGNSGRQPEHENVPTKKHTRRRGRGRGKDNEKQQAAEPSTN